MTSFSHFNTMKHLQESLPTLPTLRWEASLLQGYPLEIYHRHSFIDLGGDRLMRTKFLF